MFECGSGLYSSVDTEQSHAISINTEEEEETVKLKLEGLHLCPRKSVFGSGIS